MIIKENIIKNKENNNVEYIEAVYDSSNILQTTYFPLKNKLYVSFKRGGVYSYLNITSEIYSEFKEAESQGKYFQKNIKNNPDTYPYHKEFNLYPEELKELDLIVENNNENDTIQDNNDSLLKSVLEFYGNEENYKGNKPKILLDRGYQARHVLELKNKINSSNEKTDEEYEELLKKEIPNFDSIVNNLKTNINDSN